MNEKLASILAGVFGMSSSDINLELSRADIPNWDSLKQMDLVTTLERDYSIVLELMDIVAMTSVMDIVMILKSKGISLEN